MTLATRDAMLATQDVLVAKTYTVTGVPALLIMLLILAAIVGVGVLIGRWTKRRR